MTEDDLLQEERSPGVLIFLAGIAFILALGALAWLYFLQNRLDTIESQLSEAQEQHIHQETQLSELHRQLQATNEAFGAKVGITQRQIEARAQEILRQQNAATTRLAAQEADTRKQITGVSNAVSTVRSDVGGVKQAVATTQQQLATAQQQLQTVMGDMGVQSGLIARNASELDYLRHQGDRKYFPFTLHKGAAPAALSTIKLQLRKVDTKRSRYTLEIFSDDRRIEKKDRDLDEPLQFYSGKPPLLFEVVVNEMQKNQVSGYLSMPKDAPQPTVP